jgi:tRNA(fMet)-specific endonuclease VapC
MILDTTFLIDVMRNDENALRKLEELDERDEALSVTAPTVYELWSGIARYRRSEDEKRRVDGVLCNRKIIEATKHTMRQAGFLNGQLAVLGVRIGTMDALIATLALERDETLLTRNVKHFARIKGLKLETY